METTHITGSPHATAAAPMIDIIWNVTRICGWNCAACCVAATHVKQKNGKLLISSPTLDRYDVIEPDSMGGNIYDQALRHAQRLGLELTLDQKIKIIDNIEGHNLRLDISGGDVLSPRENYALLDAAATRLGRHNITLTATGAGMSGYEVLSVADLIGELNFTYDGEPDAEDPLRPSTYARGNLRKAREFSKAGVSTRAECPLSAQNLEPTKLTQIYLQLHEAGIDKFLLMRLFPVGRGELLPDAIPTVTQYKRAIATLRLLEARYGSPKVKLQCALRAMEGPSDVNPCDALTESFGLTWNGVLLGSPWAINKSGRPIDPVWVLGDLVESSLAEILATDKVRRMRVRSTENHGHCKIFSWLNGTSANSGDRIFEPSDPMFTVADDIAEDVA